MNRNWIVYALFLVGLALPGRAQLMFTNVGVKVGSTALNAVAYNGADAFIAVGEGSTALSARFISNATAVVWVSNKVATGSLISLKSLAYGANQFVAGGAKASVFVTINDGAAWVRQTNRVFKTTSATVGALAFNQRLQRFAAGSSFVGLSWADASRLDWNRASIGSKSDIVSFLESHRAMASFSNGFVVCGLRGVIRISSNGGTNWLTTSDKRKFKSTEADLLGIATDGAQQMVAVGTKGAIWYSTNGGANWTTANSTGQKTTNNAVAHAGNKFIVVGTTGQIAHIAINSGILVNNFLASTTNTELKGIAFATNGIMKGIAMVVGKGGIILLGGTPPPAPNNFTNPVICEGPSIFEVPVEINTNDLDHPPGTIAIDWYTSASGGTQITTNSTNFSHTQPVSLNKNAFSNYFYYAEARDLRTGFVSTNRTPVQLTVNPRPTATLVSFTKTVCNEGTPYTLTNTLTGIGPWVVQWNDGEWQTNSQTGAGPAFLTRTVVPTNTEPNMPTNNVYYITSVTDTNCMATTDDISGRVEVMVNPRATATATLVPFNATNCNIGASYTFTNILTGIGPWTVKWSDGFEQTNSHVGSGPTNLLRTVIPASTDPNIPSNNVYYVTNVMDANFCSSSRLGDIVGTNSILINPRPTARLLSFTNTVCNIGTPYTLTNTLTGIGPWVVQWNDGEWQATNSQTGAGPVFLTRMVVPTNTEPNMPSNNVYYITSVTDTNCMATTTDISGRVEVTVNPRPTATLLSFDETNCNVGTPYTLTNVLNGLGPWTVVWSSNGLPVTQVVTNAMPGPFFDNTFVVIPTNTLANAAYTNVYFVLSVSNENTCAGNSNDITGRVEVTVNPNLVVSGGPTNLTKCPGDLASFSVSATGTGLTYQWMTNGVNLSAGGQYAGVTNATLTISNVTAADALDYTVMIVGICGSSNLSAALTVSTNVGITTGPANTTVCPGNNAMFTVSAAGTGLTYQWKTNGMNLANGSHYAGATTPTLTVSNVQAADAVTYTVMVAGACTSSNASAALTVNQDVSITAGPADTNVCLGNNAVFTVTAAGTGLTYQWQARGTNLIESSHYAGVNTTNLTINSVLADDATNYTVAVVGTCTSNGAIATLTVSNNVIIMTPPTNVTVCLGGTAVFVVDAAYLDMMPIGMYRYRWSTNGVDLEDDGKYSGTETSTLTVTNVDAGDAVTYSVVIEGVCTRSATLTVSTNVSITSAPTNRPACLGDNAAFTVGAAGTGLTYQWQAHGTNLIESSHYVGVNTTSLTINSVTAADFTNYTVMVMGACGSTNLSANLTLVSCALSISLVKTNVVLQWSGELELICATNLKSAAWVPMARGKAGVMNFWTNSPAAPASAIFRLRKP